MAHVFLSVGDPSGDQHAARLVRELRARVPDVTFEGLGGPELASADVPLLEDTVSRAVIGVAAVAREVPYYLGLLRRVAGVLAARPPDLVVLVDAPALNLHVARLARRGGIPVHYVVAPQFWGWARWRARRLARVVDHAYTIHDFETGFFAGHGLPATFIGHPAADELDEARLDRATVDAIRAEPLPLALLPGSRSREVRHHLPVFLETVTRLRERHPGLTAHGAHRDERQAATMAELAERAGVPLTLHGARAHEVMAGCHAALVGAGTATLETGLLGTPMVIYYRVRGRVEAFLRDWMVLSPWFGEINLTAGAPLCPELLQEQTDPEPIAAALEPLLGDTEARRLQLEGFERVRRRIAGAGALARAAELLAAVLTGSRPASR